MRTLLLLLLLVYGITRVLANDIQIDNVILGDNDVSTGTRTITFDVKWKNSWRVADVPQNYDAAWIFLKYQLADGIWHHALLLAGTPGNATSTIDVTEDGIGAFVYRTDYGISPTISHAGMEIIWDYRTNGVNDDDLVTVEIFAIEMVYVPTNDFYLGSGGGSTSLTSPLAEFYLQGTLDFSPYFVTSENAINLGIGNLGVVGLNLTGTIPAAFPKGYQGFYCMKYEISQQQYVKFFNRQTATEQGLLDLADLGALCETLSLNRNTFCWDGTGEAVSAHPFVPISYLSVNQMLAYLDWTGLRPMTELEYEKVCRGPVARAKNDYPWGTAKIATHNYSVTGTDGRTEQVSNPDPSDPTAGNALYLATQLRLGGDLLMGPLRNGTLAASKSNSTRLTSGGSYYGVMELAGNLRELVVSATTVAGQAFAGEHGDGELQQDGVNFLLELPLGGLGYGGRGGDYTSLAPELQISNRIHTAGGITVGEIQGFRGVRTFQ